jgi:hypothetical protein
MQHTNCMRHIVICGLSGSTIFFRLSHKGNDFIKKKVLKMKCAIWFSLHHLSEKVFILRRIQRGIISAHRPSCRVNFISVRIFKELEFFSTYFFFKNPQISNIMKISQVGVQLFHAEGWKDKWTKTQTVDRQTWRSQYSLLGTLWTCLKTNQKPQHTKFVILTF